MFKQRFGTEHVKNERVARSRRIRYYSKHYQREKGGENNAGNRFLIPGETFAGSGWKSNGFFRSDGPRRSGTLCILEGQYLGLNY